MATRLCIARRYDAWPGLQAGGLTTVDDHCVSDDEAGRVGARSGDGRGDVFGSTHPADRLLRDHPVAPLALLPVNRSIMAVAMIPGQTR
jgi:hypothetical protein